MSDTKNAPNFDNVCALVNPKSGERASAQFLMEDLRRLLPGRVVDLSNGGSDAAIPLIRDHAINGVLVIAGGDGTVSWGMDLVDSSGLSEDQKPYITVIPMGTGNDLSRCLNFGPGFARESCCCGCCSCCRVDDISEVVKTCTTAPQGNMDRWRITIKGTSGLDVEKRTMNNYFSIGFDAHIAAKFDTFRTANPNFCKSRLRNKAIYGVIGTRALCGSPQLNKTVQVQIDGKDVPLPDGIKSLIVSNVNSYSGGVVLWKEGEAGYKPAKVDDGLVEVQGIYGSFHMGMMQGGMRSSAKIGQGSKVKITTAAVHHMQWDGEALYKVQEPVTVELEHSGFPKVLNNQSNKKVK